MTPLSFDRLREIFNLKNYKFYTNGIYNLNLIGVRSKQSKSDSFDDHFHVIYRAEDNRFKHHIFPCTTDPGKHWLLNPMNVKGCAIMVPGQYNSAYSIGLHAGKYRALRQTKPIWFVRDNDRNTTLDFSLYRDPEKKKKHAFFEVIGANIHRASAVKKVLNIGQYSAACQVIQNPSDFNLLMSLIDKQVANGHGKNFTYTLIEEP